MWKCGCHGSGSYHDMNEKSCAHCDYDRPLRNGALPTLSVKEALLNAASFLEKRDKEPVLSEGLANILSGIANRLE